MFLFSHQALQESATHGLLDFNHLLYFTFLEMKEIQLSVASVFCVVSSL